MANYHSNQDLQLLGIEEETETTLGKVSKKSVYEIVNEKLLNEIKNGRLPWRKEWSGFNDSGELGTFLNYRTKKAYKGVNPWLIVSDIKEHHCNYFLTKKQIENAGGKIKKNATKFLIVYFGKAYKEKEIIPSDKNPEGMILYLIRFLKGYTVYNLADTTLTEWKKAVPKPIPEAQKIENCEKVYMKMPKAPVLKHGGDQAYYTPTYDYVQMPKLKSFSKEQFYYSTLFHELAHSTMHPKRLNRKAGPKGTPEYRFEELVAEIAASYICSFTGIFFATQKNSAAYLRSWCKELVYDAEANKNYFFKAASAAQAAANYILSKQIVELKRSFARKKKKNKTLSGIENKKFEHIHIDLVKSKPESKIKNKPNDEIINIVKEVFPDATIFEIPEREKDQDLKKENKNVSTKNKVTLTAASNLQTAGTEKLDGDLGEFLGGLGKKCCSITIEGDKGAGKSQLAWQIADKLADKEKKVLIACPEMLGTSPTISYYRDNYLSDNNKDKVLFTDEKMTVKQLSSLADQYDVLIVDSFNEIEDYDQKQFGWLFKKHPDKMFIGLFQSHTGKLARGGIKPMSDAYVNIYVHKTDQFKNNYAVCTKNRYGDTGLKYNISSQTITEDGNYPITQLKNNN